MGLHLHVQACRNWDRNISEILFNLRNRRISATGKTPSEVLIGLSPKRPGEWAFSAPPAIVTQLEPGEIVEEV